MLVSNVPGFVPYSGLDQFYADCGGLTAAYAEGGNSSPGIISFHNVEQVQYYSCAACTNRVTKAYGTAVYIESFPVNAPKCTL